MIIKSISINNFKNIKKIDLDFTINQNGAKDDIYYDRYDKNGTTISPRIFGMIGPNSIGKSNILGAIKFAFSAMNVKNITLSTANLLLKNTKKSVDREEINQLANRYSSNEMDQDEKKSFDDLSKEIIRDNFQSLSLNKTLPIEIEINYFDKDNKVKNSKIKMFDDSLELTNPLADIKGFEINKRSFYLEESGLFFNSLVKTMDETKLGIDDLLKIIQIADPGIESMNKKESGEIILTTFTGSVLQLRDLSTGTKLFLFEAFSIIKTKELEGIFFIDEIDTFMHRELSQALITLMNMVVDVNPKVNFIFTTHNMSIIGENIKYKQIFEISINELSGEHKATKLSKKIKQSASLENKYKRGIINPFPSKGIVFDNFYEAVYGE